MAATPKRGGKLVYGSFGGDTSDTLYAGHALCCAAYMIAWHRSVSNTLVNIDESFTPIPELAESWEPTDGPGEWTFTLRQGVEFHNGKTFDSADVVHTYQLQMSDESTSPIKPTLDTIESVKADGKNKVVFKLVSPNADFPAILSAYQLTIHPADQDSTSGIGTGPFRNDHPIGPKQPSTRTCRNGPTIRTRRDSTSTSPGTPTILSTCTHRRRPSVVASTPRFSCRPRWPRPASRSTWSASRSTGTGTKSG